MLKVEKCDKKQEKVCGRIYRGKKDRKWKKKWKILDKGSRKIEQQRKQLQKNGKNVFFLNRNKLIGIKKLEMKQKKRKKWGK